MNAVIELDVPEWQIGQNVSVYFPDTMLKHGKCEMMKEQELVRCKDCVYGHADGDYVVCMKPYTARGTAYKRPDWFCADGEHREGQ